MGKGLEEKNIVLAASRKTDEMSTLIEKQGGTPILRSLQGTVFLADQEVEPELRNLIETGADIMIFTTGIGTEKLLELAEKMEVKDKFLDLIRQADVASRGYKTFGVLKKVGIKPVAVDEDGTTEGLIQAMKDWKLSGKIVMVQLHGDAAPRLMTFLEERGATVLPILPYQHIAPEAETVETLCQELKNNQVDAVCFTTAIQVRSLFNYARKNGDETTIQQAFAENVRAVAVGKVTAEALREEGVANERIVAPEIERMGAMIIELAHHFENER